MLQLECEGSQLFVALFLAAAPCDIHTHVEAYVRIERNHRSAGLAKQVVHANEEVEARGVNIEYPAHRGAERACGKVDAAIEPVQWLVVGTETTFAP